MGAPPPQSVPQPPLMPYSPGMAPVSPLMTPSLVPIEHPMLGKMPSLNWELNKTPAQMPSAGDIFLIKDLPPLDAPGAAPDWSVRDINWGTLTGLVCRDLLDDVAGTTTVGLNMNMSALTGLSCMPMPDRTSSPRLAPLAMTKSLSGLSCGAGLGFFSNEKGSLGLGSSQTTALAHSQLNAVRMIIGA